MYLITNSSCPISKPLDSFELRSANCECDQPGMSRDSSELGIVVECGYIE
ncbi:Uncharacterised protein [Vibrio cholerae]|nr:Uncharacterised protein [Vibrio cholerae]